MELNDTNYENMLLNHHLPPFTNYKDLSNNGIRIISRASGNYIYDDNGNKILDAMAGLWCVNIGYGRHQLAEVAKDVGTIAHHSIQELGGDLLFLSKDGFRTIAGTERIGDVELGTVSKQIQKRIADIGYDNVTAVVIGDKSQYRLFYTKKF